MFASIWDLLGKLLLYLLFTLPELLLLYPVMRRVANAAHCTRDFVICTLLMAGNLITNRFVATWFSGLNIITSLLWFFVLVRFVFRHRGWRCVVTMVKVVVILSLMEAVCMLLFWLMCLAGFDQTKLMVVDITDIFKPENMFYFSVLNFTTILLILLGMMVWDHFRGRRRQQNPRARSQQWLLMRSLLRLAILIITSLGMLTLPFTLFGDQSLIEFLISNKSEYVILTLCSAGLITIAFSYMMQDIRYLLQLQRLTALEQQQAINRSLLENMRHFRHNMVNMLYGLEGVLISGDGQRLNDFYAEMQEKCALVNNENIVALERITHPAVSAVLLRTVDRARQLSLPVNLFVQEDVTIPRTLSDADLCQVLGVLLDNATEAAHQACERYVSIELRNVDSALEIIVKNTYAGEVSLGSLSVGGASTKEGHEGQGLSSCYRILSRKKGAFLNFWVTGQYVQAQLLLSR